MSMLDVINNNFCIGCGGCQLKKNIKTRENKYGQILPDTDDPDRDLEADVCPFSNDTLNEFDLMQQKFSKEESIKFNEIIGYYQDLFIGHVKVHDFRKNGTSGGMTKWLLCKMMESGEIDGVIHVVRKKDNSELFEYGVSRSVEDILQASQSAYYPVNFAEILEHVLNEKVNQRYAFVGVPCFCKSILSLKQKYPIINIKIKYIFGIICGHMKTKNYAKLLSMNAGIDPDSVDYINFRQKTDADKNALDYNFYAKIEDKEVIKKSMEIGGNWAVPHLKYKACDYCEDVFGYCADVALGDAWIPEFINDPKGNNICIVRNKNICDLIKKYQQELSLQTATEDMIISSQLGSFNHRMKNISYRLWLCKQKGEWYPKKRAKPQFIEDEKIRSIQNDRIEVREKSHDFFYEAYLNQDINLYYKKIAKYVDKLNKNYL